MQNEHEITGYIAAACFLTFTGVGALAQVHKLHTRTRAWRQGALERERITEGLHPVREMWSFSAFFLFALSGLTRSYLDYFLLLSRLPVIGFSTIILWFLFRHAREEAFKYFILAVIADGILIVMLFMALSGFRFDGTYVPRVVDAALSIVAILLFYGKQLQAFSMYRQRRSRAVSWLREGGLVIKDLTGLAYSLNIGSELLWVTVTHSLSAVSSTTICLAKFLVERKPRISAEGGKDAQV